MLSHLSARQLSTYLMLSHYLYEHQSLLLHWSGRTRDSILCLCSECKTPYATREAGALLTLVRRGTAEFRCSSCSHSHPKPRKKCSLCGRLLLPHENHRYCERAIRVLTSFSSAVQKAYLRHVPAEGFYFKCSSCANEFRVGRLSDMIERFSGVTHCYCGTCARRASGRSTTKTHKGKDDFRKIALNSRRFVPELPFEVHHIIPKNVIQFRGMGYPVSLLTDARNSVLLLKSEHVGKNGVHGLGPAASPFIQELRSFTFSSLEENLSLLYSDDFQKRKIEYEKEKLC